MWLWRFCPPFREGPGLFLGGLKEPCQVRYNPALQEKINYFFSQSKTTLMYCWYAFKPNVQWSLNLDPLIVSLVLWNKNLIPFRMQHLLYPPSTKRKEGSLIIGKLSFYPALYARWLLGLAHPSDWLARVWRQRFALWLTVGRKGGWQGIGDGRLHSLIFFTKMYHC